jgi:hypothetical protein
MSHFDALALQLCTFALRKTLNGLCSEDKASIKNVKHCAPYAKTISPIPKMKVVSGHIWQQLM